jgi:EAL domain-containing protein (putative c-di-GMP-specific phosphodiesterase class I)
VEALSLRGLREIVEQQALHAWFQQIIDLQSGDIVGYEGLVRGPADSPYHAPARLFGEAERLGLLNETESAARQVVITRFAELELPGRLFLEPVMNFSLYILGGYGT